MQVNADSIKEAVAKFDNALGDEPKGIAVSVIWQQLEVGILGKRKARYEIAEKIANPK
ncbi:MAG: hypothetical protein HUU57_08645 [Bdellovibrio sp.]|nr:hypothetical protein [Bdellovibrio sp.]